MSESIGDLRLLEFMAVSAGLVGVVFVLIPLNLDSGQAAQIRGLFGLILGFFMLYSVMAYAFILKKGRSIAESYFVFLFAFAMFGMLIGFVFGVSALQTMPTTLGIDGVYFVVVIFGALLFFLGWKYLLSR